MADRRLAFLPALLLVACGGGSSPASQEIGVHVAELARDPGGNPVILLAEHDGDRTLPIWIGLSEARSIASQLERIEPPRPNTHDLAKRLLDGLEARVERVIVTELRDRTYYGVIVLRGPAGAIEIDARPSDAIALALRTDAPIFVREALFEEPGDEVEVEEEAPAGGREVRRPRPDGGVGGAPATVGVEPRRDTDSATARDAQAPRGGRATASGTARKHV